jgi:hypothetical protein
MFSKRKSKVNGQLGYLGLGEWWTESFNETERLHIESVFTPLGSSESDRPLTKGNFGPSTLTAIALLHALSGWFSKKEDRHLVYIMLEKAISLIDEKSDALDIHFLFGQVMAMNYKDREKPENMEKALIFAKKQIAMSGTAAYAFKKEYKDSCLPSHSGFKQFAIILEKEKKYDEALSLCESAIKEGWAGDWEKRIQRCEKKRASV